MDIESELNNSYGRSLLRVQFEFDFFYQILRKKWIGFLRTKTTRRSCSIDFVAAARIAPDLKIVTEWASFTHALGLKGTSSTSDIEK